MINYGWIAIPVLAVCAFITYYPFKKKDVIWLFLEPEDFVSDQKLLKEEKAALILALKELDFDYEVGKLSKEDYKNLRQTYEAQTVSLMKRLEVIDVAWDKAQIKITRDMAQNLDKGENA